MSNEILRRKMMRDRMRSEQRDYGYDYNRGGNMDSHMYPPQMYSNEYATGGRAYDGTTHNRFTPRGFDSRGTNSRYGDSTYSQSDNARYGDSAMRDRMSDGHYYYPFEVAGRYGKVPYYPMDHEGTSPYLTEHELKEWSERLLNSVDEKYKDNVRKDKIFSDAEIHGIRFDKFTKDEFYVTVLMMYTDYCKTLGAVSIDVYLKLAKDWLMDDDIAVKGSEKLAAYHDYIVKGM